MDKKNKKTKQNNSMFIYTSLIFAVALILIILAFFGQTNISNLRKAADTSKAIETAAPDNTEQPSDELAKMANIISNLDSENKDLKGRLDIYNSLVSANALAETGSYDEAASLMEKINPDTLTEEQKLLYNQITNKINEGREQ